MNIDILIWLIVHDTHFDTTSAQTTYFYRKPAWKLYVMNSEQIKTN
jgi:hypothetical protein